MYAKLVTLTIALLAISAGLLMLRQERLHTSHQIMEQHRQAQELRQELWRVQTMAAEMTTPTALRRRIQVAELEVEPVWPGRLGEAGRRVVNASYDQVNR